MVVIKTSDYVFNPNDGDRLVPDMITYITATMEEHGCLHFRFTRDLENPDRFFLYEIWQTRAHLASHIYKPHTRAWMEVMKTVTIQAQDLYMIEPETFEEIT